MQGKDGVYARYIKRILDVICSSLFMLFFCWLYGLIAVFVRIKLGKPIIYTAHRPGMIEPKTGQEKIFQLYKFRSMTNETDENGVLLPDSKRLTRFGRMLRSTSLDELPEVFNIFKGDMSVIGPRPLALSYLQYYSETEHHRHDVRPGLTGLAQINGRNVLSWEERFELDLKYIEGISFLSDVDILFKTIWKVLRREGIGQGEDAPISLSIQRKEKSQRLK